MKCRICGANVKVERQQPKGNTTLYYVNLDKQRIKKLETALQFMHH